MAKTTRSEIVLAAGDLMRDKGYAATSMKDVADRVGLLKGSLYSHFSSKEEMVPEILGATFEKAFSQIKPTGDWRADYETALNALVSMLIQRRRCVGFHLAYGADDSAPVVRDAVSTFFLDIRTFFRDLIAQGLDISIADPFALDTLTALEGATLWLALYGNDGPIRAARHALLLRADSYAADEPDAKAKAILNRLVGDWRQASLAEKELAARLADTEDDLLTVRAALAGQIEAEACFR